MSGLDDQQERPVTREFIGGLITGEGCFGLTVSKRSERLKHKRHFVIYPHFALQMTDEKTMDLVMDALKEWQIAFYVDHRFGDHHTWAKGTRISTRGIKRTKRMIEEFLPYLTGAKHAAASVVLEFCNLRLSKAQKEPYGSEEFALVNATRDINGGQGGKRYLESSETNTPDVLISVRR